MKTIEGILTEIIIQERKLHIKGVLPKRLYAGIVEYKCISKYCRFTCNSSNPKLGDVIFLNLILVEVKFQNYFRVEGDLA